VHQHDTYRLIFALKGSLVASEHLLEAVFYFAAVDHDQQRENAANAYYYCRYCKSIEYE
jgi:hypothetical protein